jgi:hypothetical protein
MIKTLVTAVALVGFAASAAFAETPASNPEDCLKVAFDLAQTAEAKTLSNEQLDKVEDMLTRMESYCDAKQYTEAAGVATELNTLISQE